MGFYLKQSCYNCAKLMFRMKSDILLLSFSRGMTKVLKLSSAWLLFFLPRFQASPHLEYFSKVISNLNIERASELIGNHQRPNICCVVAKAVDGQIENKMTQLRSVLDQTKSIQLNQAHNLIRHMLLLGANNLLMLILFEYQAHIISFSGISQSGTYY